LTGRAAFFLIASLVLSGALSCAHADAPEQTFEAACKAYDQGRWDEAAEGFRGLLRFGIADWRLEYNLANTEFKRGHLGEAILHYERARRLNPADPEVAGNLAIARSKIHDVVEEEDAAGALRVVRSLQDRMGVSAQAVVFLVGVWLVSGIVAWCGSRPKGFTAAWGWTLTATLLVTGLAFLSWRATWSRLEGTPRAVILKASVDALAGPALNNATLFTLHEGTTVRVQSEREGWLQVTLPNSLSGWVVRDAADRI